MRICEVIGHLVLSRRHPSLEGASWRVAVPLSQSALSGGNAGRGEPFVVFDEFGAGETSRIAVSDGAEASAPFHPDQKPIDAYNAAILDCIDISQ
ncbi:MAG: EutN/CcmL family microcompartment protein [Planctomycetaceae bacterium]